MDDAEQQPDNQGESSDKTADDDVECEDSYCAGYAVTEGDEPETHPADAEWEADTEPHQEVVTYAVRHIDRLEECGKTKGNQQRKQHFLEESLHILTLNPCKSSVRMPTRYQSAAISIRVGFHLPPTMTSKHSPQCRPP